MDILRFDDFEDDTIVLHFGGERGRIDAYTLAEVLTAFADMARAISATIEPGTEIEIVVEATAEGSFRTRIRRIKKDFGGLLTVGGTIFWSIVANYIYDNYVKDDPPPQITINEDGTVVKTGKYTIIIDKKVHQGTENAKKNPAVQKNLSKTFSALEADENVTDFGITNSIKDKSRFFRSPASNFRELQGSRLFLTRN